MAPDASPRLALRHRKRNRKQDVRSWIPGRRCVDRLRSAEDPATGTERAVRRHRTLAHASRVRRSSRTRWPTHWFEQVIVFTRKDCSARVSCASPRALRKLMRDGASSVFSVRFDPSMHFARLLLKCSFAHAMRRAAGRIPPCPVGVQPSLGSRRGGVPTGSQTVDASSAS